MKHIYTLLKGMLAALLLGVPSLASAQTLAELAGKWTLTADEVAFGNGSEDGLPASSYDVTITVDEATSTAYLAGFPGTDVTPSDGVFQGTYQLTGISGYVLTVALPVDSKVTLADGAVVGYSADSYGVPWHVTQDWKTKAITIKQPSSGTDLVFSYTKGTTSTTLVFSGVKLTQKTETTPTYSAAPADLAGTYAITTGAATFDGDTEDITNVPATSYTGTIKVNANGEATMTGLIGTPMLPDYVSGTIVDSCYVGKYDAAAQTITFSVPADYFITDDEENGYMLLAPFTVKVSKNDDGCYVLSTSDAITYEYQGENWDYATCSFAGVTMTQQKETPSYSPAPADLAGKYVITTGAATFAGDTEDITTVPETTYKATVKVNANGEATMTGLIGTPMSQDELTGETSDSCYVGVYDAAASTITFSIPSGYFMTDIEYNAWMLKSPFTVSVAKGDDGKYVLTTADAVTYDFWGENEDEATCSFAGLTMTQQPSYTISKEDLLGDWELTFNTIDDDLGEIVPADSTMTFTILEKDGALKVTNVFGSTYEYALNYSSMGVDIPFTTDYIGDDMEMGTQIMICGAYDGLSTPAVSFDFGADNTLELASMLFCMNENGQFLATSGTAKKATKVDPEPEPDPEPQALGEAITDITKLSNDKVYAIYNPVVLGSDTYTSKGAYVVYNPSAANPTYLWSANGEKGQFNSVSVNFSLTDENHAWMAIQHDGNFYLYNLGTKMFLSTYGWSDAGGTSGPSKFTATPTPLTVVTRTDGNLAFTSHADDDHSFLCAAPQFTTYPMAVWTSDDNGSAWVLKENPNLAADPNAMALVTAISSAKAESKAAQTGIYTISGVKMNTTDLTKLPKGVYIVNGKKQIVK